MQRIDPNAGWRAAADRQERCANPRHHAMLGVLRNHMEAEMAGDLDGMLMGLAPEPAYHMWQNGRDGGPKGLPAITDYYRNLLAVRRGVLEYVIERFVIDDETIVTEGFIRAYQPGRVARDFGFDVPELDATYLVTYRALILWPFDAAGNLLGEDGYGNWDPTDFELVPGDELPDAYVALFADHERASVGIPVPA